jgi:hypothetical protein
MSSPQDFQGRSPQGVSRKIIRSLRRPPAKVSRHEGTPVSSLRGLPTLVSRTTFSHPPEMIVGSLLPRRPRSADGGEAQTGSTRGLRVHAANASREIGSSFSARTISRATPLPTSSDPDPTHQAVGRSSRETAASHAPKPDRFWRRSPTREVRYTNRKTGRSLMGTRRLPRLRAGSLLLPWGKEAPA